MEEKLQSAMRNDKRYIPLPVVDFPLVYAHLSKGACCSTVYCTTCLTQPWTEQYTCVQWALCRYMYFICTLPICRDLSAVPGS